MQWNNKKVAILGYGVNNQGLVEYLLKQGAHVTIADKNVDLGRDLEGVTYRLGPDYLQDLTDFAIVFRTPGLPYLTPELQEAKMGGVVITSQTQLFLEECTAQVIGVTGTKGKGTTASLITHMLERSAYAREIPGAVYLAGNIGQSPLSFLDKLTPNDWVVLELSSFQLQDLTVSPHIAVVLSITPDHLDHHKSAEEYVGAKKNIVAHQIPPDFVIVNHDSPLAMSFLDATHAQPFFFSRRQEVSPGAFVADGKLVLDLPGFRHDVIATDEIPLLGSFNQENVAAATVASSLAGASITSIRHAIKSFQPLPHRMELVGEINGVRYIDNSYATMPDATIAAIESFNQPVTLIVGGSSKGADFSDLVESIKKSSVTDVICIGQEGQRLRDLLAKSEVGQTIHDGGKTMAEIVDLARKISQPGSIILLSPAAASFDMFKNAADRGNQFKKYLRN